MAAQVMFIGGRDKKDKFSLSLAQSSKVFFPVFSYSRKATAGYMVRERLRFVGSASGGPATGSLSSSLPQPAGTLKYAHKDDDSSVIFSCGRIGWTSSPSSDLLVPKKQIAVFLSSRRRRRLTIISFPISFLRSQFDVAQVFLFYFIYSLSNFLTSRPRLSRRMSSAECEISTSSLSSSRRASRRVSPWMR